MKKIAIAVLAILILAFILAAKAFAWVFVTIFHYGIVAICLAVVLWLLFTVFLKSTKKEDKS